jgi:hypothetical protein
MKKGTRLKITPIALLVLLLLLTLLVVKRKNLTAEEAEEYAVWKVVQLEGTVDRDDFAAVAFLAVTALFAFVMWTALRAREEEEPPPTREPSASGTKAFQ